MNFIDKIDMRWQREREIWLMGTSLHKTNMNLPENSEAQTIASKRHPQVALLRVRMSEQVSQEREEVRVLVG